MPREGVLALCIVQYQRVLDLAVAREMREHEVARTRVGVAHEERMRRLPRKESRSAVRRKSSKKPLLLEDAGLAHLRRGLIQKCLAFCAYVRSKLVLFLFCFILLLCFISF